MRSHSDYVLLVYGIDYIAATINYTSIATFAMKKLYYICISRIIFG